MQNGNAAESCTFFIAPFFKLSFLVLFILKLISASFPPYKELKDQYKLYYNNEPMKFHEKGLKSTETIFENQIIQILLN